MQTINHQEGNLEGKQNMLLCMMSTYISIENTKHNQSNNQSHQFDIIITYAIIQKFFLIDFSRIETRVFPGMAILAVAEAAWMSS